MLIGKSDSSYPYGVEYHPENKGKPITVWQGPIGQGRSGGDLTLDEALLKKFERYFERSGTMWFREIIEKMSQGIEVSVEEIEQRAQE